MGKEEIETSLFTDDMILYIKIPLKTISRNLYSWGISSGKKQDTKLTHKTQ